MENGAPAAGDSKDPSTFLSEIIGVPVTVKLNSGVVYKGWLCRFFPGCASDELDRRTTVC